MAVFSILMFPASEGDCLMVEYGDPRAPDRILIDGGRKATYQNYLRRYLAAIPREHRRLRLFVVTHIDRDHIEGAVALLRDETLSLDVDDLWFNAYSNLISDAPGRPDLHAVDGESLTYLARERRKWRRNHAFGSGAVSTGEPARLCEIDLGGGMVLTLLGPDRAGLRKLIPQWQAECRKAGIMPGGAEQDGSPPPRATLGGARELEPEELAAVRTPIDPSPPNGTSITFLLSYAGCRVLFCADARPIAMQKSLDLLGARQNAPLLLDAVKVSHHASKRNVTEALLARVQSPRYLISTDGTLTGHPDCEAVARIVTAQGPRRTLFFNYRNDQTLFWDRHDWKQRLQYATEYGTGQSPLVIDLPPKQ